MAASLLGEMKLGLRLLAKGPVFAVMTVLSLGIGIGSLAAVYTTLGQLLDRLPRGVADPDRLVMLQALDRSLPELTLGFSRGQYEDLHGIQDAFSDVAAFGKLNGVAYQGGQSDQTVIELVTGNFFAMLGMVPAAGRTLLPADDVPGGPQAAMISFDYWQRFFGQDPRAIGEIVRLNGADFTIVGVASPEFEGFNLDWLGQSEVWVPLQSATALGARGLLTGDSAWFPLIGRLAEPQSVNLLEERAQGWISGVRPFGTSNYTLTDIAIRPAHETRVGNRGLTEIVFAWSIVVTGLVLLAACLNTANILFDRAMSRRKEMAVRVALGATRGRLFRQALIETGLIGAFAAVVSVVVAIGGARVLAAVPWLYVPVGVTVQNPFSEISGLSLLGPLLPLAFVATLLFGLGPALFASSRNPNEALRSFGTPPRWLGIRLAPRQALLAAQVGVAVALVVVAGLCIRSLSNILSEDTGYSNADSLLVSRVLADTIAPEQRPAYYRELLQRLEAMPDVESATIGSNPPLRVGRMYVSVPGRDAAPISVGATAGGPAFFATQGVAVVAGQDFDDFASDSKSGAIINRVLADRFWPDRSPADVIGQSIVYDDDVFTVTGVVADDFCNSPPQGLHPCVWIPFPPKSPSGFVRIHTRTAPTAFVPTLRRLIAELDPEVALVQPQPFSTFFGRQTGSQRAAVQLTMGLAIVGVALFVIGSVALFLSMVKNDAKSLATRMALGATNQRLLARMLSRGMTLTAIGIVLGVAAALLASRSMENQLYGIKPADPLTFLGSVLLVASIGLATIYFSGRAIGRIEPAKLLRED